MTTPSPTYVCPRCQTVYTARSRFCGRCGGLMDSAPGAADDTDGTDDTDRFNDNSDSFDPDSFSSQPSVPRTRRRSSDRRDLWLGKVVDSRYRVIEVIGRGGMGVVYKVEHQRMGKIAAMKVLHREYAEDAEVTARFRREAEAVSRLDHPNVAQVFDFGSARGQLYLIMEYVRGLDLGTILDRDGPLPFVRAAPLFNQICSALAGAHSLGVIHRDLKPENVLVMRTVRGRDFIKVLDFGLAKLSEREDKAEVTDRGVIVGTPYYMSPEQIRGEDIDARTDVYSLGALMYRVLTGKHAYTAKTPVGVLTQHLTADLVLPSQRVPELDIPDEVDRIVARTLEKKRDDRHLSIDQVQDDLERAFLAVCEPSGSIPLPAFSALTTGISAGISTGVSGRASAGRRRARRETVPLRLEDSDQIDYGIDTSVRLRRADFDAFESSLRRRRAIRIAMVPLLLLAGAAVAVYLLALRPEAPRSTEKEPNDEIESANPIASGAGVTGLLGKRISKTVSDHDYYRIAGSHSGSVVTASLTALPNMDVELSLLDGAGNLLTRVSEGGVGHAEWIHRLRIRGSIYILVTEAAQGTGLPTENVSDPYQLVVTVEPADPGWESEPNESPSDAVDLVADRPISGYLDRRGDVDTYRFDGAAGRYTVSVEGASGVPLAWQVLGPDAIGVGDDRSAARRQRSATVDLAPGALVRLQRGDSALPAGSSLPGVDAPYTLRVTAAP